MWFVFSVTCKLSHSWSRAWRDPLSPFLICGIANVIGCKCLVVAALSQNKARGRVSFVSFFFLTVTHQLVSCSVHLRAPLDGVVEPLVAGQLLLNGSRIVPPLSRLDEALEQQTGRKMNFTQDQPARNHLAGQNTSKLSKVFSRTKFSF